VIAGGFAVGAWRRTALARRRLAELDTRGAK
jgi:hypothetical protein